MIKITRVTGESLSPFFLSGDYVVITTREKARTALKQGDVVVFDHPEYGTLIKFVRENHIQERIVSVQGSNSDSVSSHKLGPIPYSAIRGKVLFSIKQKRNPSHR